MTTSKHAEQRTDGVELPPLPKAQNYFGHDGDRLLLYDSDDVLKYATSAVLAEREACAALCGHMGHMYAAKRIRDRSKNMKHTEDMSSKELRAKERWQKSIDERQAEILASPPEIFEAFFQYAQYSLGSPLRNRLTQALSRVANANWSNAAESCINLRSLLQIAALRHAEDGIHYSDFLDEDEQTPRDNNRDDLNETLESIARAAMVGVPGLPGRR